MNNPLYSYHGADGVEYDATPSQLKQLASSGTIRLDDTVIDFLNGQPYLVREILALDQRPPTMPMAPGYAAYPRNQKTEALPVELRRKFNFGAFGLTWIWGLNHKKPVLLLALVPCYGFILAIYAGINGYKWAWESGRFQTPEECKKCQDIWTKWALAVIALYVAVYLAKLFLVPTAAYHPR